MSQRSQYLYASYATTAFGGWPDTFYGYINSDKVILIRVTPFTVGTSTQYFPEMVIDAQMVRLRRKLDGQFDKKLLHTVRGVGFILREEGEP